MPNLTDVDQTIAQCLQITQPKSFFLFAGAGSGKTRSLVNALRKIKAERGPELRLKKQRVAVITYTNAACDEILRRLDFDPLFTIATIHSFSWKLIKNYHTDIKKWLKSNLEAEIAELREQQAKGRAGTKASLDRAKKIESKTRRLENLNNIKAFTYNPNGDNRSKQSLNHSEVIGITAHLLNSKPLMRDVLTRSYPFLLIDESQDTNKHLMEAFLLVQRNCSEHFALGLFGDTMQRIYADGKQDLGTNIPQDWETPAKLINYRCPKRVIQLINRIRQDVDQKQQTPKDGQEEGFARLFIVNSNSNKQTVEEDVSRRMAAIAGDELWSGENKDIKTLTLEHHMAASRMGFIELFEPLYKVDSLRTGLTDGSLGGLNFFRDLILPLVRARKTNNEFEVARVIREHSLLLDRQKLRESTDQILFLKGVKTKVDEFLKLWETSTPTLIDALYKVAQLDLFTIPDSLIPIATRGTEEQELAASVPQNDEEDENPDEIINAWDTALSAPFEQLEQYHEYMSEQTSFDTHQGVKGLEFPRVMVVLDDEEARGFLFSYGKLLGADPLSATDQKNIQEGKETTVDRTRRLFYVTCSRAEKSLAIVAYTNAAALVRQHAISQGWFGADEIIDLNQRP